MADDVEGIFKLRVSAATLEQLPTELDEAERGALFVAWPRPPRVGAFVRIELSFGDEEAEPFDAQVVWSRPGRQGVVAGFRAQLKDPPDQLLARLRGVVEVARHRVVSKDLSRSGQRRAAPIASASMHDAMPIRERITARSVTTSDTFDRPRSGLLSPRSFSPFAAVTAREVAPPPPIPVPPNRRGAAPREAERAKAIDFDEDDLSGGSAGSEFAFELGSNVVNRGASAALTPQEAAPSSEEKPAAARPQDDLAAADFGLDFSDLEEPPPPPPPPRPPPAAPRAPAPPPPKKPELAADDFSDLAAEFGGDEPPAPPPRASAPPPPRKQPDPPKPIEPPPSPKVAVQSAPPPPRRLSTVAPAEPIAITFASTRTYLIHFEKFLQRNEIYITNVPPLAPAVVFDVVIHVPDGDAPVYAKAISEREVFPPEVPRQGWVATLVDPEGEIAERLATASFIVTTPLT